MAELLNWPPIAPFTAPDLQTTLSMPDKHLADAIMAVQGPADHSTRPITALIEADDETQPVTAAAHGFLNQITTGMLKAVVTVHGRSVGPVSLRRNCLRFSSITTSAIFWRNTFLSGLSRGPGMFMRL